MKLRVFGSSLHKESGQWQVWTYDAHEDSVKLLGAFWSQLKAETAAFDLAHAAAKGQEPSCITAMIQDRDAEPVCFDVLIEGVVKALIYDAIEWSTVPKPGTCEMAVRRTDLDQIFVVTFPGIGG